MKYLQLRPWYLKIIQFYLNPFLWYKWFMRRKTVDFRSIDVRIPDNMKGYRNHKGYRFTVNNLYIEHIDQQSKQLLALKTELFPGDSIYIDTTFGWYSGQGWKTFPIKGEFRIRGIFSDLEIDEIRLLVHPVRLRFPL